MAIFPEYEDYDALGLADLVRSGEVTARELVETAIDRVEALNPRLNAVTIPLFERALARAGTDLEGTFAGVPYLLKDMVAHEGTPLTFGSGVFKKIGFVPNQSHEVVSRSEAAGLNILGKTNACELGLLPITEPEAYGSTANPWNLKHSPGGSSGGTGSAVAAGIVPMAHGNDGGGSIRIPASACGLFGLKPSRGRNPGIETESADGIAVEHCLSRSVRDSAALLDVTRGARGGDRWWAPEPTMTFLEAATTDPKPLRIAFATEDFGGRAAHPDCAAAVTSAAALCESLGHHVEEAAPKINFERFSQAFVDMWSSMATSIGLLLVREARKHRVLGLTKRLMRDETLLTLATRAMGRSKRAPFEAWTREAALRGARDSHAHVSLALVDLARAARKLALFLEDYDVFLTPVLAEPPVKTGSFRSMSFDELKERVLRYAPYTPLCNSSGLPAMSVPLHWNSDDLPIGTHFMTRFGHEELLFQLAGQLERAQPWFDRRPTTLG